MRSVCLIVFSAVIVASAGPLNPWGAPDDRIWPAASAFAGPGIAYAGGGGFVPPFGFPFGMPPMFPFGMVPFPAIPTFPQPWYKGPNVCQETKYFNEPDEVKDLMNEPSIKNYDFSQESESCRGNGEVYVCTGKTMTNEGARMYATKYKCCHGFVRVYDARGGCVETDLKDLIPALRDLKATKFLEMAEMTGFVDRLHDENFTVFCPPDNSIENTDDDEMSNVIPQEHYVETRRSKSADTNMKTFTSHLTKGFIRLDDLEDEIVVDTENPEVRIRLNVYNIPYKLVMANCVPVTSYNNYARNGIIHTVEKKLPVATKTVADIIAGDSQFSILKRLLSQAGLVPTLRDPRGNFTVFAPSDISFQVDPRMLDSLIDGTACVDNLLKNHIVDHVICSSALANEAQTANLLGEFLTLSRHLDSKIYVDDVQVVVKDIVGTNGVVHIIDGILNPRQAKRVIQVLEETSINQFLDLLKRSELASYFDQIQNVTFLVPSNVAVRKFPRNEMQRILSDKNKLNDLILNHVIRTEVTVTDMENVPELHTASENGSLRVRTRRAFPFVTKTMTIQCANIISPDNRLCGSILHVVDRVLPPAKRTVVEELESRPEFSMFLELLRLSGLDRRLSEQSETFTVLAPIDEVFLRLPRSFLENLRTDRLRATHFLKTHIISDYFCCDHLAQNIMSGSPQVRSVDGSLLRILSYPAGVLRIGEARIIDCDVAAHNGVLHAVDNIVYNERTLQQNRNIFFDPVWTGV